jgi:hypothetical protein
MEDEDEFGGVDRPDGLDVDISAKTIRCEDFAVTNYFLYKRLTMCLINIMSSSLC